MTIGLEKGEIGVDKKPRKWIIRNDLITLRLTEDLTIDRKL